MSENDHPLKEFGKELPPPTKKFNIKRQLALAKRDTSLDEDEPKPLSFTQYGIVSQGIYTPNPQTREILPAGIYEVAETRAGFLFKVKTLETDSLLVLPDNRTEKLIHEINTFWARQSSFRQYGFLYRRGVLLWGPSGSGKSLLVQQICKKVIDEGDVVFVCNTYPHIFQTGLEYFRQIEPDRRCVCVFEDIDALIDEYGDEQLLQLLDGEDVIDGVLNIATSNYPEKLDKRIVSRPRRFDAVIKIDMPSAAVRRFYLEHKLKISGEKEDIDKWVVSTENFSFAALAELVISVKCLGKTFDESVKTIKSLLDSKASSEEFEKSTMGFKVFENND